MSSIYVIIFSCNILSTKIDINGYSKQCNKTCITINYYCVDRDDLDGNRNNRAIKKYLYNGFLVLFWAESSKKWLNTENEEVETNFIFQKYMDVTKQNRSTTGLTSKFREKVELWILDVNNNTPYEIFITEAYRSQERQNYLFTF